MPNLPRIRCNNVEVKLRLFYATNEPSWVICSVINTVTSPFDGPGRSYTEFVTCHNVRGYICPCEICASMWRINFIDPDLARTLQDEEAARINLTRQDYDRRQMNFYQPTWMPGGDWLHDNVNTWVQPRSMPTRQARPDRLGGARVTSASMDRASEVLRSMYPAEFLELSPNPPQAAPEPIPEPAPTPANPTTSSWRFVVPARFRTIL